MGVQSDVVRHPESTLGNVKNGFNTNVGED